MIMAMMRKARALTLVLAWCVDARRKWSPFFVECEMASVARPEVEQQSTRAVVFSIGYFLSRSRVVRSVVPAPRSV